MKQEKLKELLHYNPDNGLFTWLKPTAYRLKKGDEAGCNSSGYRVIKVDVTIYRAHRLAFLYMEGELPPIHVDHINRVRDDNRWCNLRHSTNDENMRNRHDNNQVQGVYYHKPSGRWLATTRKKEGKRKHIGSFRYYLQACAARFEWEALHV